MRFAAAVVALMGLVGCTTYPIAQKVKLVSFDEDVTKGKSAGPIRGEHCIWTVLGYKLGGQPTLDVAMANARNERSSGMLDAFGGSKQSSKNPIRYMTNVSTGHEGWNAVVVGKNCLVVKGTGYR